MLPPIEESVLQNNPDFERLYKTVTGSLLNVDGSTKSNDAAAKKRDAVRHKLKTRRLEATKQHLLCQAITASAASAHTSNPSTNSAASHKQQQQLQNHRRTGSRTQTQTQHPQPSIPAPPPEILDLLLLLTPFLTNASTMSRSAVALLLTQPPFSSLEIIFPNLTATLSSTLSHQAGALARVLNPSTNPSYIHRTIPSLTPITVALQSDLRSATQALSRSRQRAAFDLTTHLSQHARALSHLVRVLEAKHGAAARSAELRAADVSLAAQEWAVAAEALLWDTWRAVYPPEARRALVSYRRHLGSARMRLADAVRVREAELGDYGVEGDVGKERAMREMARVWRDMEARLREVRVDLDRLG
ncbi:hypothetical protein GGR54DRAFT_500355 [Hypoxylon sp. NC1633]|nr:hypothetical protein GGR54DRAFT_500355 [Hypoxylon sp. NC1633]